MKVDLSRVREREALKPQREPHWQRLRPGCFLGYRPSARGGAGSWIARAQDDEGGYKSRALGDFGGAAGSERFAAAKKEAEQFADLVESGGQLRPEIETVADACRAFAEGSNEIDRRFRRYVYGDPIGKVKLAKLRRHHTPGWRRRREETPALVSRNKVGERRTRPRALSSINRDQAALRAAIARALPAGAPNSEAAWQEPLKPIKNATGRRTLYLDLKQRRALVDHLDDEAAPFVRALCLLPLRPGAVAKLTVGDFDGRTRELTIGRDKNGKPRRVRIPLDCARFFAEQSKDRDAAVPLFTRANGKAWEKETWKHPIAAAVRSANLPAGSTAYTLRHSTITDLVNGRLPLLTIAQISGTSVQMIEKHYGHLDQDVAEMALVGLSL
jgi:integrase